MKTTMDMLEKLAV